MAVVATLKLRFCKALTLGASIGDAIAPPVLRFTVPLFESVPSIPPDYHRWIPLVITYVIKYFTISAAFFLQRIISALHSSLRGGLMISRNMLEYLKVMNIVTINDEDTYLDEVVGYALAALGFLFQLRSHFRLPFPINLLLLPVSILEFLLTYVVGRN